MFWSFEERSAELVELSGNLDRLKRIVDFEMFRAELETIRQKERKDGSGRKPYDVVLMFKILVLQALYNLSDEQAEYQIKDRISFMNFLGLALEDAVPDQKTIWLFRDHLRRAGLERRLFERFDAFLSEKGLSARKGQILDATIIETPRRHLPQQKTSDAAPGADAGAKPAGADAVTAKTNLTRQQQAQTDSDARWTRKHGRRYFGYKNHVSVDVEHKLVRSYDVTDASVYDGHRMGVLLRTCGGPEVYADSHYSAHENLAELEAAGFHERVQRQGRRNHPLDVAQRAENNGKARVRARVEHVFARMKQLWPGRIALRAIGLARVKIRIAMLNLVYNFDRCVMLLGKQA